jgi:hypothetical protein
MQNDPLEERFDGFFAVLLSGTLQVIGLIQFLLPVKYLKLEIDGDIIIS